MNVFCACVTLQCPSDWTEEKARAFVTRQLLSSKAEKDSLCVFEPRINALIPDDDGEAKELAAACGGLTGDSL